MAQTKIGYEDYRDFLDLLTDLITKGLGDSLISLVLYGSVARGEASKESDIDILIIQRGASTVYYERLKPILEAERELRSSEPFQALRQKGFFPYISYLILSDEEARENRYIFLDMIDGSRVLYDREGSFERRLEELRRRLKSLGSRKVCLPDGSWYWDLKPDLVAGEVFEL